MKVEQYFEAGSGSKSSKDAGPKVAVLYLGKDSINLEKAFKAIKE
jgi:hypothetical protein